MTIRITKERIMLSKFLKIICIIPFVAILVIAGTYAYTGFVYESVTYTGLNAFGMTMYLTLKKIWWLYLACAAAFWAADYRLKELDKMMKERSEYED